MRKLLLLIATFVVVPFAVKADILIPKEYKYFTVSADAEVKVQPNRLSIVFGINHRDPSLKDGKDKMHKIIKDSIAYCVKKGVKEKNIQTAEIQVRPKYEYNNHGEDYSQKIIYYEFNQSFTVVLDDLSNYEDILYALLDLGINKVDSVNLYSTDMLKYRNQARVNAINAAKDKAKLLTSEVGMNLGRIVSINEGSNYSYYGISYNRMGMSNVSQNVSQVEDWSSSDTGDLSLGMIPIKASVTITYEIVP